MILETKTRFATCYMLDGNGSRVARNGKPIVFYYLVESLSTETAIKKLRKRSYEFIEWI